MVTLYLKKVFTLRHKISILIYSDSEKWNVFQYTKLHYFKWTTKDRAFQTFLAQHRKLKYPVLLKNSWKLYTELHNLPKNLSQNISNYWVKLMFQENVPCLLNTTCRLHTGLPKNWLRQIMYVSYACCIFSFLLLCHFLSLPSAYILKAEPKNRLLSSKAAFVVNGARKPYTLSPTRLKKYISISKTTKCPEVMKRIELYFSPALHKFPNTARKTMPTRSSWLPYQPSKVMIFQKWA